MAWHGSMANPCSSLQTGGPNVVPGQPPEGAPTSNWLVLPKLSLKVECEFCTLYKADTNFHWNLQMTNFKYCVIALPRMTISMMLTLWALAPLAQVASLAGVAILARKLSFSLWVLLLWLLVQDVKHCSNGLVIALVSVLVFSPVSYPAFLRKLCFIFEHPG